MIGVLTYDIPHRKTFDTLCLLKSMGYDDVVIFAFPLHYEKKHKPLVEHRPKSFDFVQPKDLCDRLGFKYYNEFIDDLLPENSKMLICGSGIIEKELINKYRIINSHPGYLPNVRGLDALKWAIYEDQPIGVTTHQLGDEIDAGLMIDRKLIPIYFNDTFHSVAQRQYETEIIMLIEAIQKIDDAKEIIHPASYKIHKRMPHEYETRIFNKFDQLANKVAIN